MRAPNPDLDELNAWMRAHHMHGFWFQGGGGTGVQVKPHIWKWESTRADLAKLAERSETPRMLRLENPEQRGVPGTVGVSLQLLMPSERASAERGLANQTWLVVEAPPDASVLLNGVASGLEAGDLIVAPGGTDVIFHNGAAQPGIILCAADAGLIGLLGVDDTGDLIQIPRRPPVKYAWSDTLAVFSTFKADGAQDAHDGLHLRYTSPIDGGSTLPTLSCEMQLLLPGLETRAHRHNTTAIYVVIQGRGHTDVAGEQLEWSQGDVFCIPPWAVHRHANSGAQEAILYSVEDWPTMRKMGFYRVERDGE